MWKGIRATFGTYRPTKPCVPWAGAAATGTQGRPSWGGVRSRTHNQPVTGKHRRGRARGEAGTQRPRVPTSVCPTA